MREETIQMIIEELKTQDILYKKWKFACFTENTIIYEIENEGILNTLEIISDRDFFDDETGNSLISKLRIKYLRHAIYIKDEVTGWMFQTDKTYNPMADLSIN